MSQNPPMSQAKKEAQPSAGVQRAGLRPPLGLEELVEILVKGELLTSEQGRDIQARSTTLKSRVLKEKVGSVRSQAAARYDMTPAEIVAAAALPHPKRKHGKIDENAVAEVMAQASDTPHLKIDPLRIDNDLITKTLSRAFAQRHAVIAVGQDGEDLVLAVPDPFDSMLRESLSDMVTRPLRYVVAAKCDIQALIARVYGFRRKVSQAAEDLGSDQRPNALVQLVELRSDGELAARDDEHVVTAVEHLLNYAFEQRASDIHLEPRAERRTSTWSPAPRTPSSASASTGSCTTSRRFPRKCTTR